MKSNFFRLYRRAFSSETSNKLTNDQIVPETFYNRNPRNLERLRIAYKPSGYHLDVKGKDFWHKYVFFFFNLFFLIKL